MYTRDVQVTRAFAAVILMLVLIGALGVAALHQISKHVEDIYRHPFAVTNAVKNINLQVANMDRSLKNLLLAPDEASQLAAVAALDAAEVEVYGEFDEVYARFLGDTAKVDSLHAKFREWRPLRDQIIFLARSGDINSATQLTQSDGARYVDDLRTASSALIDFALAKAEQFRSRSVRAEHTYMALLTSLVIAACVVSVLLAVTIHRRLAWGRREVEARSQLIDQRICIASVDAQARITEVSRQLARSLGTPQAQLLGEPCERILPVGPDAWSFADIQAFGGDTIRWRGQARLADRGGTRHWFSIEIHPLDAVNGEIPGYTLLFEDVTEKVLIEEMSLQDKLTGLPNRRAFDEAMDRLVRRTRRGGGQLTLAILDIDHFKEFNDRYGHPRGDSALAAVANAMRTSLGRPDDTICRIGGEEFALMFVDVDAQTSTAMLETLRQRVEDLAIAHEGNAAVAPVLTVSIGAVTIAGSQLKDADSLYQQADRRLYRAKERRNCVVLSELASGQVVPIRDVAERQAPEQPG